MNIIRKKIEIKLLRPNNNISIPKYGTIGSAGIDLQAAIDMPITIKPNDVKLIPTGISIYIHDPNLVGMIYPRSGLGHKKGLILGNGTGIIDSDYQGELFVSAYNRSIEEVAIEPEMKFAQLLLVPIIHADFALVEEFSMDSIRGVGGFGHTGT